MNSRALMPHLARLRHPALVALVLVAAVAAFVPQGTSNDDVYLAWLISGQAIGEQSAETLFINPVVTYPLTWLYDIVAWIPWYAFALLAAHAAALAVLFSVVSRHLGSHSRGQRWMVLAIAAIADLLAIVELSWNSAGMVAAVAGVISLLSEHHPPAVGIALVVYGTMLRWESAVGALLVLLPVIIYRLLVSPSRRRTVIRLGIALAFAAGAVVAHQLLIAGDAEWRAFDQYNSVRGPLHDSNRLDRLDPEQPELVAIDVTANDLELFRTWFYDAPDVFGQEQLEVLDRAVPVDAEQVSAGSSAAVDTVGRDLTEHLPKALGLLAMAAWVASDVNRSRRIAALATLAAPAILVPLLFVVSRVHGRVLVALISAALWGAASLAVPHENGLGRFGRRALVGVAAVSAVLLAVSIGPDNWRQQQRAYDRFDALYELDPEGIYLLWDEPLSDLGLFRLARLPDIDLVPNGWLTFSPSQENQLRRLGVSDQFVAAVDDPRVYIPTVDLERGERVATFLAEHRSRNVVVDPEATARSGVLVFTTEPGGDDR